MMILRFWAADGRHVTNRIAVVKTQSRPSFICTSEISTDVTSVLQAVAHEREFFAKVTLPLPVRWLDSSWDTQTELSSCAIQPMNVTPSMARWMTHSSKGPAFAYSTISVRSCQNSAPPATHKCIEQDGSRGRLKHGMQFRKDGRQIGSARQRVEPWSETQGYFFFQAEDGIRDYKVTGVQTCALPI